MGIDDFFIIIMIVFILFQRWLVLNQYWDYCSQNGNDIKLVEHLICCKRHTKDQSVGAGFDFD